MLKCMIDDKLPFNNALFFYKLSVFNITLVSFVGRKVFITPE